MYSPSGLDTSTIAFVTRQELRDCEWWVTEKLSPLIGGEPLAEGVKNNIFAYYDTAVSVGLFLAGYLAGFPQEIFLPLFL